MHTYTTVNMQIFTGLHIHGFSPMKLSQEYFQGALANSVHHSTVAKYSQENFPILLKTGKTMKVPPVEYFHVYITTI